MGKNKLCVATLLYGYNNKFMNCVKANFYK